MSTPANTGRVVNQHGNGWCGSCYLISAVQVLEDRIAIQAAKLHRPRISLDLQDALSMYRPSQMHKTWNACMGGLPVQVWRAIQNGELTCRETRGDRRAEKVTRGFPTVIVPSPTTLPSFVIERIYHVAGVDVERELSRGPVTFQINSDLVKSTDKKGRVAQQCIGVRNHVVAIVDCTATDYICRNSWGTKRKAPLSTPSNMVSFYGDSCIQVGSNTCDTKFIKWNDMPSKPGHFMIPKHHPCAQARKFMQIFSTVEVRLV